MQDFLIVRFCFLDNFHIVIFEVYEVCCFLHFNFLIFSLDFDNEATKDILNRAFYLHSPFHVVLIFIWRDLSFYFACKILYSFYFSHSLFSNFASL